MTEYSISLQPNMPLKNNESQVLLALQAMRQDPTLSAQTVGWLFDVDHQKLSRRKRGMQSRRDISFGAWEDIS